MPSIISPTGRALQAELQNMPPDQVQAYLAQNVGKVPMAELLAMKMQLDRMRQALPQQQIPQSTVAQDMQAQLQQARGISALPVQNVGQPQNYAGGGIVAFQEGGPTTPFGRAVQSGFGLGDVFGRAYQSPYVAADPERARLIAAATRRFGPRAGLAGAFIAQSDAERKAAQDLMERLPSMTNQELRALVATSGPTTRAKVTGAGRQAGLAELPAVAPTQQEQTGLRAIAPRKEAPAPEAPAPVAAPKTIQDYLKEEAALREQLGVGTTLGEREKYIKEREAKTEKDLVDRARMSRAQAFFKMAEESAKPGGTFLKGATAGLSQYAEAKQALADKREQMQDLAKERQFALQEAREQLKLGDYKAARAAQKDADKRAEELADKQAEYAQREKEIRLRTEGDLRIQRERDAAAVKEALVKTPELQILQRQFVAETDRARKEALRKQIEELVRQTSAYAAAMDKFNMQQAAGAALGGVDMSKWGDMRVVQ